MIPNLPMQMMHQCRKYTRRYEWEKEPSPLFLTVFTVCNGWERREVPNFYGLWVSTSWTQELFPHFFIFAFFGILPIGKNEWMNRLFASTHHSLKKNIAKWKWHCRCNCLCLAVSCLQQFQWSAPSSCQSHCWCWCSGSAWCKSYLSFDFCVVSGWWLQWDGQSWVGLMLLLALLLTTHCQLAAADFHTAVFNGSDVFFHLAGNTLKLINGYVCCCLWSWTPKASVVVITLQVLLGLGPLPMVFHPATLAHQFCCQTQFHEFSQKNRMFWIKKMSNNNRKCSPFLGFAGTACRVMQTVPMWKLST